MTYLSEAAKKLIARVSGSILLAIVNDLVECLANEDEFCMQNALLKAPWLEREIDMLPNKDKFSLIKEILALLTEAVK